MGIQELTDPQAVLAAIAKYDARGRYDFLKEYDFGQSQSYWLVHGGRRYDSKAIVAAAYGIQHPDKPVLRKTDFSAGAKTVEQVLTRLGFTVEVKVTPVQVRSYIRQIKTGSTVGGGRSPHKPLLILLMLQRLGEGKPRLTPAEEIAEALRELLSQALPEVNSPSAWEPIWRLERNLWEIVDAQGETLEPAVGQDPPVGRLIELGTRCGFLEDVYDVLVDSPDWIPKLKEDIVKRYLNDLPSDLRIRLLDGSKLSTRAWWVNQGQSYRQERDGGYVWAPIQTKSGHSVRHHLAVRDLKVGDTIVHYSGGAIRALGQVSGQPYADRRPIELPDAPWSDQGYRADVNYFELERPIELVELTTRPRGEGPFSATGSVNQGYLYELTPEWASDLRKEFAAHWPEGSPWSGGEIPVPTITLREVVARFNEDLLASGYRYRNEQHGDVVRSFLISLATKPFVILTGLSGSGKTKVAQQFGKWLGTECLEIIAVRPDWMNPDPLLGYENGLSNLTETGYAWNVPDALAFILHGIRHPDNPHVLLLDEMNLAHVERYFADVLSGMESDHAIVPDLIHSGGEWRMRTTGHPRLPFPKNLFVVGTVNVDETTYMFSPKVLDRANTIEFRVATDDLQYTGQTATDPGPTPSSFGAAFLRYAQSPADKTESGRQVAEWLKELHRLLSLSGREFGHRTYADAIRFADLLAMAGQEDPLDALDIQVLQKVLPRYHGSIRELSEPLNQLGGWCFVGPGRGAPTDFDAVDDHESPAALPRSFDKIHRMAKRLRANHFVSFAE